MSQEEEKPKRQRRGGNVKRAPAGFYTATEAIEHLGLNKRAFYDLVDEGRIKRYLPPLKKEGYYDKKEIDRMAIEIELFFRTHEDVSRVETRAAIPADAQGIHDVLAQGFGWRTADVEQRLSWYKVNRLIDYVVLYDGEIAGYITAVPYRFPVLEKMMAGQIRAWHIQPEDILSYVPGRTYDLYVGAAVRKDFPHPTLLAFRLLSGFIDFLIELAKQGITIHHMFAVSAEEDGRRLCRSLGFVQQETRPGDLFQDARFILDLETSNSRFALRYREAFSH